MKSYVYPETKEMCSEDYNNDGLAVLVEFNRVMHEIISGLNKEFIENLEVDSLRTNDILYTLRSSWSILHSIYSVYRNEKELKHYFELLVQFLSCHVGSIYDGRGQRVSGSFDEDLLKIFDSLMGSPDCYRAVPHVFKFIDFVIKSEIVTDAASWKYLFEKYVDIIVFFKFETKVFFDTWASMQSVDKELINITSSYDVSRSSIRVLKECVDYMSDWAEIYVISKKQ